MSEEQCLKCGTCCHLTYYGIKTDIRCPNLQDDNLCAVYEDRPAWCLTAEQMKILDVLPDKCGYNLPKKEE